VKESISFRSEGGERSLVAGYVVDVIVLAQLPEGWSKGASIREGE